MPPRWKLLLAIALTIGLNVASAASGDADSNFISFYAPLSSRSLEGPVQSAGTGYAQFTFDRTNQTLNWFVTFRNLTSPPIRVAIWRPGLGRPSIQIDMMPSGTGGPVIGSARVNADQVAELLSGFLYVTVGTQRHTDGEIRGQIQRIAEP
jgi:hypothetical protein